MGDGAVRNAAAVVAGLTLAAAVFAARGLLSWEAARPRHTAHSIVADVLPSEYIMTQGSPTLQPRVINVTSELHVAVGYALANSIWLSGPEGVVVVDTTESMEAAREVHHSMREVISGPIKGIIYTHSHPDHCFGTKAFIEDPSYMPEIWAHSTFEWGMETMMTTQQACFVRGMRQFGTLLPPMGHAGIGIGLRYKNNNTLGLVMPNRLMYGDEQNISIAGIDMQLIHIPGETDDQIGVWLPEQRTFLCADDMYKAFPNLYAIRGVPMRNARKWISSLDRMRQLKPRCLVPSHGLPLEGEEKIYEILTAYRDALQYVHDQTIRFINLGWKPEDIARHIRLPRELLQVPYLRQLYGTVEWSVRSVFDQYMGWFSGDATDLTAISTEERARWMVELAGGEKRLLAHAQKALNQGNDRWALMLASHVFTLNKENAEALELRLAALKGMAHQMTSTNGRHYYLTTALEDHALVENRVSRSTRADMAMHMTVGQLFIAMKTRLRAERVKGLERRIRFDFTDVGETWFTHLRRGILEVIPEGRSDWETKVITDLPTWQAMMGGDLDKNEALRTGKVRIQGKKCVYSELWTYFELE